MDEEENSKRDEGSDPLSGKLAGLNERLDELLLELGELKDAMPSEDDVENLGKPHKNVQLKPTRAETKQQEIEHESDGDDGD